MANSLQNASRPDFVQVQLLDLLLQCLADGGRWEEALGWCEAAFPAVPVKQQRPLSFWKVGACWHNVMGTPCDGGVKPSMTSR